jgi:hypothetical protein
MNKAWVKRVQKLELALRARAQARAVFRYGSVQRLPNDAPGDRHIVVTRREPTALPNVERCEFEERLGSAPADPELSFHVYLNLEDEKE